MAGRSADYHGLLIVDKPGAETQSSPITPDSTQADERLYTSHDIVQLARRWSHQRRIGHTGTLDPMASGVLVLCMGTATRLVEYYQGHEKQYYAEIVLGIATDTYDALGRVTEQGTVPALTPDNIEAVLARFRGDILQRPPIYSALKQGGESLHRKARRGESVEIKARPITVHTLDLVDWIKPDRLAVRMVCSAGSYVRSLAHDIGQELGCGAHLALLRRERAGQFSLEQAHRLDEIAAAAEEGNLADLLLPTGYGLTMPQVILDDDQITRLGHGQTVLLDERQSGAVDVSASAIESDTVVDTVADTVSDTVSNKVSNKVSDAKAWHEGLLAQGRDDQEQFLGILRCLGPAQPPSDTWRWKANKWLAQ